MDVLFFNSSMFDIPPSRRVGVMVHDGAADLQLWPGPSHDRELCDKYGPGLQRALDVERRRLGQEPRPHCDVIRLHPGKLHCDWLGWVVTREPEPGAERGPAPDEVLLERAVMATLAFCSERNVQKVAFPALGDGPGEMAPADRVALIVETAHRYEDTCFKEGKPPVVEEVLVCESSRAVLATAKKRVARLLTASPLDPPPAKEKAPKKARARQSKRTPKAAVRRLSEADLASGRMQAAPYDRTVCYAAGQWIDHKKFGLGRVESTTVDKKMELLFANGDIKVLIHDRS